MFQKKQSQDRQNKPTFDPPNIFVTEEHLKPPQPVERVLHLPDEQVAMETSDQNTPPADSL